MNPKNLSTILHIQFNHHTSPVTLFKTDFQGLMVNNYYYQTILLFQKLIANRTCHKIKVLHFTVLLQEMLLKKRRSNTKFCSVYRLVNYATKMLQKCTDW